MKKINITKMCNVISVILLVCFIINTVINYTQYSSTLNSAPFYIWVVADALYFVFPAIVVFVVGVIIKMKNEK